MKRRVFITGDSGMLGSAIKKILSTDTNYEILNVDQYRTYINEFHYFNGKQVKPAEVDITDLGNLTKCIMQLDEHDIVINCAAYVNTDKCVDFSYEAVMSNVIGTQNIVQLCKKVNCTLINFSTTAVFDPDFYMTVFQGRFDETTLAYPKTIYGATKYASELAVKQGYDKQITIKPVFIYGNYPYDNSSNLMKIFKQYLTCTNDGSHKLPITLSTEYKKNYMHSDYFALMMKQIIDNTEQCLGQDFIISRDPDCGKTFDHWIDDLGDTIDRNHNRHNSKIFDVYEIIKLEPEADYLKDHLGYSANFYKHFPDFELPEDHKDDMWNLQKSFQSINQHFTNHNTVAL